MNVMMARLIFLFCTFCFACGSSHKESKSDNLHSAIPASNPTTLLNKTSSITRSYNFTNPSSTYILDKRLSEISGLSYDHTNHSFLANDDESGFFYYLDAADFSVISKTKFSKKGDYESIEKVGDQIIVCKNSGKLYMYDDKSEETTSHKTPLRLQNDVEGLCYLESENSLLLACKGQPIEHEKGKKSTKCIYSYKLSEMQLDANPVIIIRDEEIKTLVDQNYNSLSKSAIKKLRNKAKHFAPSAIAVHPLSGEIFISSARGSTLIIYDQSKQLNQIIFLDEDLIPQPEGLTFDDKYNLFIATEGQGYNGKVFKFEQIN